MTELKTLKEAHDFYEENWKELKIDFIDYLKAEAVKHYKEVKNNICSEREIYAIKYWINHFFNLTEEDLKEKQ